MDEVKVLFFEGKDIRSLKGVDGGPYEFGFLRVCRRDGTTRINPIVIIKIEDCVGKPEVV